MDKHSYRDSMDRLSNGTAEYYDVSRVVGHAHMYGNRMRTVLAIRDYLLMDNQASDNLLQDVYETINDLVDHEDRNGDVNRYWSGYLAEMRKRFGLVDPD